MKIVALGQVAAINPRAEAVHSGEEVSFVGMAELDARKAVATPLESRAFADVAKGYTIFRNSDLLVAKITPCWENGKVGQARLAHRVGVGSTEFHVVRPTADAHDRYLLHFLRLPFVRGMGALRMTGSAGQKRVPVAFLNDLQIPLPSMDEQRRIAAILDHADALRAKRRQVLAHLDALTQSIFHDMFPPDEVRCLTLGELCQFNSGGTPSKKRSDFWEGPLPWFSAKDLKAADLFDSADHVSRKVLQETSVQLLPRDTVTLVVRGMILAHTVPVSVLRIEGIINQDLKALLPHPHVAVETDFLAAAVRARSQWALARVSTAAHGTKKLETPTLAAMPIPAVGSVHQREFGERVRSLGGVRRLVQRALAADDELFASLQSRAFKGEL